MTDRDALIARLRSIDKRAEVMFTDHLSEDLRERFDRMPEVVQEGWLDAVRRCGTLGLDVLAIREAADALSTPPPAEPDDQTMSDAATLRGYIRTHGETPAMTWSSREHWKARAEQAEAALATRPPADLVALLKDTADALWGMQMQPDCWCPPGISAGDYHTDACRDARAVSKRLLAYPPPAPDRSDRNDTRRDCTCLGSCRGPEGLGERWKCALGKSPAPDRSDR